MKNIVLHILSIFIFLHSSCESDFRNMPNKSVFRYNESSGIASLDPAFAKDLSHIWAANLLYNGLVQLDDNLLINPCIAKTWHISEDGKIYTFHLRKDVFFHDHFVFKEGRGRRVVAQDFLHSFNRLTNPATASPGIWVFNTVEQQGGHYAFFAPNDSTFVIKLKQAFPPFLGMLAMKYCSVLPHEATEYFRIDFRNNPVGTGPFQFKFWKESSKLVLVKNPKYFEIEKQDRLPYIDAVSISFLTDKQAAFLEFVQGKLDFMSGIDVSYKDELLTQRGELKQAYADKIKLISTPYLNTEYLGILLKEDREAVLQNKLVRKAINYGFDRVKMMKFLHNNIGAPGLQGIIPVGMPAYDSTATFGYSYQPDKVRSLLKQAGYANGQTLPPITLSTTAGYVDLCKYIQQQLNELGFDIKIEVSPPAALRELKAQAKLDFFRASWIADYPDEENYLSLFYSKNLSPAGPNYTHFNNSEFDKLYEHALTVKDQKQRRMLYRKMDSIIMEEAPVVILYYDQVLRFVQKNIEDIGINAVNMLDLKRVRKY